MKGTSSMQFSANNTVYVGVDPLHRFCHKDGSLAEAIGQPEMSHLLQLPETMSRSIRSVRDRCNCALVQSEYKFGQFDIPTPELSTMCTAGHIDREIVLPEDVIESCMVFNKSKNSIFSNQEFNNWLVTTYPHLVKPAAHDDDFFIRRVDDKVPAKNKLNIWMEGVTGTSCMPASATDAFQELLVERGIDFRFLFSRDGIASREQRMPEQERFLDTMAVPGCVGAVVFETAAEIADRISA